MTVGVDTHWPDVRAGRRRSAGPLVLALLAALPLGWYVLASGSTIGVVRPYHAVSAIIVLIAAARPTELRAFTYNTRGPTLLACAYVLLLTAAAIYNDTSPADGLQQAAYLATGISLGTLMLHPSTLRWARWAPPVAAATFIIAFTVTSLSGGLNPGPLLVDALRSGDPNRITFVLFRGALSSSDFGDTARVAQRHSMFGGLLVAMYIGQLATHTQPLTSSKARAVYRAGLIGCVLLILLSLSRQTLLGLALLPVGLVLRAMQQHRITRAHGPAILAFIVAAGVAVVTGVAGTVLARLTDTSSYAGRSQALSTSFQAALNNPFSGVADRAGTPAPHNFVVEALLDGGIMLAGVALMFLIVVAVFAAKTVADRSLPVQVALLSGWPLVRMLTSGSGDLHLGEWMALGAAAAFIISRPAPAVRVSPGSGWGRPAPAGRHSKRQTGESDR